MTWDGSATNWITTCSGRRIDLRSPDPEEIDLFDIALALGHQCRFTGQVRVFYSVAEHCLHVASLVPEEHKLAALLHDAHEAYIADMSTPMKAEVGDAYRKIEQRLIAAMDRRFNMGCQLLCLPESVKTADRIQLMTERDALMSGSQDWGPFYEGTPRNPLFTHRYPNPEDAAHAYMIAARRALYERDRSRQS